ncbi:MAG: hypothetical protein ACI9AB_002048 [Urechidicola sp.]|jgi:hypothetical protein
MWFEKLTGFKEVSPENVRSNLRVDGDSFVSKGNNKRFTFGKLEIPTLTELKKNCPPRGVFKDRIQLSEVIGDVQELHKSPENSNALFQAASQFNLLEMVGPHITPEQGIDRYERDYTQGPACAIACGAGTIYRNYFVELKSQIGQTSNNQIDCLELIGKELGNDELSLWSMNNGYAQINQEGLLIINKKIADLSDKQREELKGKLKVGIQWNTEVTISNDKQKVSQIYCSALPVIYSSIDSIYWESFARVILEATYEATLYTALINLDKTNSNLVYLTLVGGGAFGNREYWILESLQVAINKFRNIPLDVRIVSYGESNVELVKMINDN